MNHKNIITVSLLVISAFVFFVSAELVEVIFDWVDWPVTRDYGLSVPEFVGLGIAAACFFSVFKNESWMLFFEEAVAELAKVVYPTPKESSQAGVVVVIMVSISVAFLAVFDWVWAAFTGFVMNVAG